MNPSGGASGYIGSGAYCFSNSVAMALAASGAIVDPAYIEVATGSPFGMQWEGDEPTPYVFPDPPGWDPAVGLATFFADHDVPYTLSHSTTFAQAKAAVIDHVERGLRPVIGPVDVGLLPYRPGAGAPIFSDHYVSVVGSSPDGIVVHDPGGYPASPISWTDLEVLWIGETISYTPGPYPLWTVGPLTAAAVQSLGRRIGDESIVDSVRTRAVTGIENTISGSAIERLGRSLRSGQIEYLHGHLVWFALALASRRWSDAATFFGCRPELVSASSVASAVATEFGTMQAMTVRRDYERASERCDVVALLWQDLVGALRC